MKMSNIDMVMHAYKIKFEEQSDENMYMLEDKLYIMLDREYEVSNDCVYALNTITNEKIFIIDLIDDINNWA